MLDYKKKKKKIFFLWEIVLNGEILTIFAIWRFAINI